PDLDVERPPDAAVLATVGAQEGVVLLDRALRVPVLPPRLELHVERAVLVRDLLHGCALDFAPSQPVRHWATSSRVGLPARFARSFRRLILLSVTTESQPVFTNEMPGTQWSLHSILKYSAFSSVSNWSV